MCIYGHRPAKMISAATFTKWKKVGPCNGTEHIYIYIFVDIYIYVCIILYYNIYIVYLISHDIIWYIHVRPNTYFPDFSHLWHTCHHPGSPSGCLACHRCCRCCALSRWSSSPFERAVAIIGGPRWTSPRVTDSAGIFRQWPKLPKSGCKIRQFSGTLGKKRTYGTYNSWGPRLVQITPISLWFVIVITIVFMWFINQHSYNYSFHGLG